MLVAAISCVISLGICFYGFKIKQLIFALIIGYTCYKMGNYFLLPIIEDSNLLLTLCAGIGLFFAMFYKKLYKLITFLACFSITYLICDIYISNSLLAIIIGIILGIILGIVGIKFLKAFIIFITSIFGSITFVDTFNGFLNTNSYTTLLVLALIIAILGIYFQFKNNKDF